jgi:FkbM family methyltransferase
MSKLALSSGAVLLIVALSLVSGLVGVKVGRHFQDNQGCCLVPTRRNIPLSIRETLRLATFHSQIGQDKWVTETMFPDVTNGFFLDVGSGDGTVNSNSKALEEKGWTGICVDPFPKNMTGRTCQMFKEVVFSEAGRRVEFKLAGDLGGITKDLGRWKSSAASSPTVEFTTATLGDILERAHAPRYIQYISLDIEGAELDALRGLPLDKYRFGALDIEHNNEEPKRGGIEALLNHHGYRRVHMWYQDDFYAPVTP